MKKILLAAAVALLAASCAKQPDNQQTGQNQATSATQDAGANFNIVSKIPEGKTVVFSKEEGNYSAQNRLVPYVGIYKKTGDQPVRKIAVTGGKVGYPQDFKFDPVHKLVYVNQEKELDRIDPVSNAITTIYTAKVWILGYAFSPDYNKIFLAESGIYTGSDNFSFVMIDLKDNSQKILLTGTNRTGYVPMAWRADNKIILMEPMGEGAAYASFDLNFNKITELKGFIAVLSQDGKISSSASADGSDEIDDLCNDFSGSNAKGFEIRDPITDALIGHYSMPDHYVSVISFSPDDKQVLFTAKDSNKSEQDCNKSFLETYYTVSVDGTNAAKVGDVAALEEQWGIADRSILKDDKGLDFIAEY